MHNVPTITQVEAVKEAVNDITQRNVTILTPDQTSTKLLGVRVRFGLTFCSHSRVEKCFYTAIRASACPTRVLVS